MEAKDRGEEANDKYRRVGSRKWENCVLLGYYGEMGFFILRWSDLLQDFEDVLVAENRIRVAP